MKGFALLMMIAMFLLIPLTANAFECPRHLAKAKAKIEEVSKKMMGMKKPDMQIVYALLDDAKTFLRSGQHNHSKPQGLFDHARSIAKADAAYGHALAAQLLLKRL